MIRLIEASGLILVVLALLHAGFPRYFRWDEEATRLSLINRQLLYIHTFFIALTVLLMGLLCLGSARELAGTALGARISLLLALFWACRAIIQFCGFSPRLWRGKRFETFMHVGFSGFWIYLTLLFLWVWWQGPRS